MADRGRNALRLIGCLMVLASCTQRTTTSTTPPSSATSSPSAAQAALLWSANFHHALTAPTVAGGVVYVADRDSLIAMSAECSDPCEPIWTGRLPFGNAAIDRDTDYTGTATSHYAPVVSGGHVFVTTQHPWGIASFPTTCTTTQCPAEWWAETDEPTSEVVVASGSVFVASGAGRVLAFSGSCRRQCAPEWTVDLPGTYAKVGGGPHLTVAGRMVVVMSSDRAYAVDAEAGRLAWWGGSGPGGASGEASSPAAPVVYQGTVYATLWGTDPNVPRLDAFPLHCRADGRRCPATWSAGTNDDFLGWPFFGAGTIYAGTETTPGSGDGTIYAYGPNCGQGACSPAWSTRVSSELVIGWCSVQDGVLYAVSREQGDMYAFPVSCSDGCAPLWTTASISTSNVGTDDTTSTGPYAPAFVNGKIVFTTSGGSIRVFDPSTCPTDGSICAPSMSWDAGAGSLTEVAVDADLAYVSSEAGVILAFRV
ncbi:MAG: PQQ-binding-like beta-propeller repeat protein [Actinobacteria bacterium]|nr:PQQ-binding-like beta-propeller repeat protein [Actinomycetota bacterium]